MNQPELPSERSMDDVTRARMRSDLIAATAQRAPRPTTVWLAPVAASVALLAVVGTTGFLLAQGSDDPQRGTVLAPAGSAPAGPQPPAAEVEPTVPESAELGPADARRQVRDRHLRHDDPSTCAVDVEERLPGAEESAAIGYDGGRASLWSDGTTWVVCDTWAAVSDGGRTTLIGERVLTAPVTKEAFRISQNYAMKESMQAQYFAGGPAIAGVTSIRYTFPDGHVADAELGDEMWLMAYLPTSGPLVDGNGSTEPITVKVTRAGGAVEEHTLDWATDTCAQVNHGC